MKLELENYYPLFKLSSINNDINPTVDILIESIDRFSFGDESDEENLSKKENGEKIKKERPNNYGAIKTDNNLIESNSKIKDLNSIINNIEEIQLLQLEEKKKNKGKICGIFNKEDFEIKLDDNKKINHKNNQLNDSFEKKYSNPLKNILDDDDDNNNNIKEINIKNIIEEKVDKKEEIKIEIPNIKNNNIKNNDISENNLINSNANIKIDNYESDDVKNPEIDKVLVNDINSNEKNIMKISKDDEIEKEKEKEKEKEPELKEVNNNENIIDNIDNPINQKININVISENIEKDDEIESPRLGRNFIESEEIKKIEEEEDKKDNSSEKENDQEKLEIKENEIQIVEKQIEPSLNIDINKNQKNEEEKKIKKEIIIEKKEEKNSNLAELKENSFIIQKISNKEKKENDNEEANKKILELTQKLEKSEKESQKIKETNEKLLEVINMFKNLQSIETKKTPNSGKNSRSDTPKRQIIKKKCFTPTLSKTNIIYGNAPVIYHKRSNSYNKIRVIKNNENKLFIDYLPVKQKTYRQLHGKENNQKKEKKINQKINVNNNPKMYGNYINRNTIYLTGANSNKYAKSPYLNNNMNYTGISYNTNLTNQKHINTYNNYLYMNNSSQSFFINNHINDTYGNLYQRQVMQLPPNEQPLFYETKSNINNNTSIYKELVYNKNINYNSENNNNRHQNIIENTNKYLQEMPAGFNNSNDLSLNNNFMENANISKSKRNKNKILDFKDFQVIFEESNNNHKNKNNQIKTDNNNIINNSLDKNNNDNINEVKNSYENHPNKNYNLINYREYSNYKLNDLNNNLNNENQNNFEEKKALEKLSKGIEDDPRKKKPKGKNENNYNNLNFGIINNFNKNKKKNYKNNNSKNNNSNNNLNSKEFGRNREKIDYNNCFIDSYDFNGLVKDNKKNNRIKENMDKEGKDFMLPFYLINRNEMLNNILNYISNDKSKKRMNNPINEKKKSN